MGLGLLFIVASGLFNNSTPSFSFFSFFAFSFLKLAGVFISCLLLWYEVDKANPTLQKICTSTKNANCGAVLNSKQAKLFGIISWSEVGFFYFASTFLFLLLQPAMALPFLALLNVAALPYTLFSVYYQWRIAKQWCVLCLAVQAVLVLEFIISIATSTLHFSNIATNLNGLSFIIQNSSFIIALVLPLLWYFVKPLLLAKQQNKRNLQELNRVKYNPDVFFSLLHKQKNISNTTNGLGILVGNAAATNTVVKVCNPYCGPCAKAHPKIDSLLHQIPNLKAQILFTANEDENDFKKPPVKHLLAIASKGNEEQTHKALDDWYLAKEKNYETFAAKYPTNGELEKQSDKITAMRKWSDEVGIAFTPTIFFNGYQLPEAYNIEDIRYFVEEEGE